ncbi:hypothetical protein ACE4V3_05255 (plasmid) [Borrelia recurrentis]
MKSFYIKFGSLVIFIISCSQATQENLAWKKAFGIQKSTNSTYSLKSKQDKLNKLRKGTRNTTEKIKEKPLELEKKIQEAKKQDKKAQEAQQLESELESARKKQEEIRETKLQKEKEQEAQRLTSELESELELARKKQEEIRVAKAQEAEQKRKKQLELEEQIAERGIIAIEEKIEELESKLLKAQEEEALAEEAYNKAYDKLEELEEAEQTENEEEKIQQAQQEEELALLKYEEMQHAKSTIEQELKDTKKTLKSEQAKLLYAQSGILQDKIKEKETILNELFQLTSQISSDNNPNNSITNSNRYEKFPASYGHGLGIPLVSFSILMEVDRHFFTQYFNDQAIAATFKYNKDRIYPILLGVTRIYDAYQKLKQKDYYTKQDENYKKMKEYSDVTSNFLYNINSMIPSLNYQNMLDDIYRNIHKVKINATIEELSNIKDQFKKYIQKLLETANKIHRRVNSVRFQQFNVLPETEEYYKVFKSINDDDLQQEIKTTNDYFSECMAYVRSIIKRVIPQES